MRVDFEESFNTEYDIEEYEILLRGMKLHEYIAIKKFVHKFLERREE